MCAWITADLNKIFSGMTWNRTAKSVCAGYETLLPGVYDDVLLFSEGNVGVMYHRSMCGNGQYLCEEGRSRVVINM